MAEQSSASKGRTRALLLAIPVLLIVAVAVNRETIAQIVRGERTLKGVIMGMDKSKGSAFEGFKVPASTGAEDAKVTVEVFVREGDGCHIATAVKGMAIGQVLDPERVRIVFRDTGTPEGLESFKKAKVGCEQGMAINGRVKFELRDPSGKTKPRVVYLTAEHALGGGHAGSGVPADASGAPENEAAPAAAEGTPKEVAQAARKDPMEQLGEVLDQELRDNYDGKGLGFTPAQFAVKMQIAMTVAEAKLQAEAEARAKAQEDGK